MWSANRSADHPGRGLARVRSAACLILAGLGLLAGWGRGLAAADPAGVAVWSQFRGPRQGVCEVTGIPRRWQPETGIRWTCTIPGRGHSSPVHNGETIWLTTAAPDGSELGVVAVDGITGQLQRQWVLFTPPAVEAIHADNSYASPSPVWAANRLYVHYGTYGTACLDTASGEIVWSNTDYHCQHDGGPGSSPVLFEDRLILTFDGADQQYLVALASATGRELWRRARSAPFRENPTTHRAFSTPLLIETPSGWQLISPGADQCHGYDPRTGAELWHVRYVGFSTVPCPAADAEHAYFCTGYYKPSLWAVSLAGRGDVTGTHLAWKAVGPIPDTPSPLLDQGRIYTVTNQGIASCHAAATGERLWVKRLGGNYSASPLALGGLIYFCSEEGITHVIDPAAAAPQPVSSRLPGAIKATPAVIGHDLLIRTDQALYRITNTNE